MTGDGPLAGFIFLKFLINNDNNKKTSLLVDQFTSLPISQSISQIQNI